MHLIIFSQESDEVISQAVKDSMVLQTKNYTKWNWLTIDSILKVCYSTVYWEMIN